MIIAVGDSFVFGNELADCDGLSHSYSTYSAKLAGEFYLCSARAGYANSAISRVAVSALAAMPKAGLLITWTYPQRAEFRFDDSWVSINSWHTEQKEFSEEYFKHVGNSEYYELYSTLKEILFVQQYCKIHNVPYMMMAVDNSFYLTENYFRRRDADIDSLYQNIDWTRWFWFDQLQGFYQWSKNNKYTMGTHGHPLEQAHSDAAELIKEKFDELVKKPLGKN